MKQTLVFTASSQLWTTSTRPRNMQMFFQGNVSHIGFYTLNHTLLYLPTTLPFINTLDNPYKIKDYATVPFTYTSTIPSHIITLLNRADFWALASIYAVRKTVELNNQFCKVCSEIRIESRCKINNFNQSRNTVKSEPDKRYFLSG